MQPYPNQPVKTRRPVLIFLKIVGPPLVLYVDDSDAVYNEIKQIIANASEQSPKLVEKIGKGPLKKLAVLDTQIAGVAIQEEAYTA
ncbi:MAG: hypothetical protein A2104_03595 [Candidatus Melainabacteria bacterium GWF2_32_7]|nr:MAG: hypothetical protein A2104_03595 [Candidatus Melainabacteria bacterium GWF2_32_7]